MSYNNIRELNSDKERQKIFITKVLEDLDALEYMLDHGYFESDAIRIGAEQEMDLVDENFKPFPIALKLLEDLEDDHLSPEYALFNIEINSSVFDLGGRSFTLLREQLEEKIRMVEKAAEKYSGKVLLTGILPTLKTSDLKEDMLTPLPRYRALADAVIQMRGASYEFHIKNIDELITRTNPGVFGGAFTSFQFHLQVPPDEIVAKYNWSQLILAPLLASAASSPVFLGKRLWHETRVSLFQQTSDTRRPYFNNKEKKARVSLGDDWVRDSILEVFRDNLAQYPAFLGKDDPEDPIEVLNKGGIPQLSALQFFNGTIYPWNRLCYGVKDNKPHLRIENRIFPAGPSMADQIANAAFWVGLMQGMPAEMNELCDKMPYSQTMSNFQKAARYGMEVEFVWLDGEQISAKNLILKKLLPIAYEGLRRSKVDEGEIQHYLEIIEQRVSSRKTGARWILNNYDLLSSKYNVEEMMETITAGIYKRQKEGKPVHEWTDTHFQENKAGSFSEATVDRIMTTKLITVLEDHPLNLAINIFIWKEINHLPVEDEKGKMTGLLSKRKLFDLIVKNKLEVKDLSVRDVMQTDLIKLQSSSSVAEAISLMMDSKISCLPVVDEGVLMGLVTQYDFVRFSRHLMEKLGIDNEN